MKVTDKDVAYVADLANLEFTDDERAGMLRDLNSILEYVDRLNELDTSNVPPMAQVSDRYGVDEIEAGERALCVRKPRRCSRRIAQVVCRMREALANAPDADEEFLPGAEGD